MKTSRTYASLVAAAPAGATPAAAPFDAAPFADVSAFEPRVGFQDLTVDASIGVYAHERVNRQPIRLGVELDLVCAGPSADDARAWTTDVLGEGHITLVETLAERIAARCLADARVRAVVVRVEKLTVFPDVIVGIEITRSRA